MAKFPKTITEIFWTDSYTEGFKKKVEWVGDLVETLEDGNAVYAFPSKNGTRMVEYKAIREED